MLELPGPEACSQGLQVSARRHHWLVHEDPLAPLLVLSGFQRGQKSVMPLRREKKASMEENVRQELDVLKQMMNNWKRGFLLWASPDGDNQHVLLEFTEEIQEQIYPYVTRLRETENLNHTEAKEFMDYCYSQVEDLRDRLEEVETDQTE
jgi:hypothetical protein